MRRATNPTRKISITIPGTTFNLLESHLSYNQSRSKFISRAIEEALTDSYEPTIPELTTRQLMAAITARDDADDTLKHLLLQILSK